MDLDRRTTYRELLEGLPDLDGDPHEQAVASIEAARLRRELRRPPAFEREVLCNHYGILGRPALVPSELAERFGLSGEAVRELEERGLQALRERMCSEEEAA